ncbi:MAG: hypothetical protein U0T75_06855 [Chitinophagales bacterium]
MALTAKKSVAAGKFLRYFLTGLASISHQAIYSCLPWKSGFKICLTLLMLSFVELSSLVILPTLGIYGCQNNLFQRPARGGQFAVKGGQFGVKMGGQFQVKLWSISVFFPA